MLPPLCFSVRTKRPERKPKSLGIRSLVTTMLIVYGVLALLAILFNLPAKSLFTRGLQSFLGFLIVEKVLSALSQSQLGQQWVSQQLQLFTSLRLGGF